MTDIAREALISSAWNFAFRAHENQKRKYTGDPYFGHCHEVAYIVSTVKHTPEMIAAAFLHDVVEDTPVDLGTINREFGLDVAKLVYMLTDKSKPHDGNRATRKRIDREFYTHATPEAKTIKCADLISNTRSIVKYDPKFAKVYLQEKRLLMPFLIGADPLLWDAANDLDHAL